MKWEDIKESMFLSKAGRYKAKAIAIENKVSSTGNDMLEYTFETEDGEQIRHRFVLLPQSMFNLKNYAKAIGYNTTGDIDFGGLVAYSKDKDVIITVEQQEPQKTITGELSDKVYYHIVKFEPVENA